jgi:hypothetical protein
MTKIIDFINLNISHNGWDMAHLRSNFSKKNVNTMLHAFFRILVCGQPPCAPFWAFALDLTPKRDPGHLLIFYSESKIAPKMLSTLFHHFLKQPVQNR